MKKIILYIFLLFLGSAVTAQINTNPDSLAISASQDTSDLLAAFEVTNNYASSVTFWWKLEKGDDCPEEWTFQICDVNTCYFEGVEKCPKNNPNVMDGGVTNSNFSIKIKPKGVLGSTLVHFNIYSDSDFTNLVSTLPVYLMIGTSSVKNDDSFNDLSIFPNPTVDKFMLKNAKGVEKLEIFNIAGKKMRSLTVSAGAEFPVTDLRNGLYLVRFLDKAGKVVKVVRLSKR